MRRYIGLLLAAALLAGCTTTEEANQAIKSRWIGQSSDSFFARYGPPMRQFPLNNGGTIYSWRGGETTQVVPAEYRSVSTTPTPVATNTSTTTVVNNSAPNTTVTETRTTSTSIGIAAQPTQVMVRPERVETLFCEAQLTVDAAGLITNIEASRDTTGAGLSLSRCAEVFGVS